MPLYETSELDVPRTGHLEQTAVSASRHPEGSELKFQSWRPARVDHQSEGIHIHEVCQQTSGRQGAVVWLWSCSLPCAAEVNSAVSW